MAPKKKDKGKLHDWMQCSLCGNLVSSQDAEAHSASCDSDHGTIQGGVFLGKVIRADDYLNEGQVISSHLNLMDIRAQTETSVEVCMTLKIFCHRSVF